MGGGWDPGGESDAAVSADEGPPALPTHGPRLHPPSSCSARPDEEITK